MSSQYAESPEDITDTIPLMTTTLNYSTLSCAKCGSRTTRIHWYWNIKNKPHCRNCYRKLVRHGVWTKGNGWRMGSLIANPFKGRTHSLESRLKISANKCGKSNSMKGRRMPQHAKFGESNPSWKGGISILSRRIRRLAEYKEWRSKVFQRDNFTCQECGRCVTYLHAHHIRLFHKILMENHITTIEQGLLCPDLWLVSNAKMLCIKCQSIDGRPKILIAPM